MAEELGAELSLDLDSARREVESFRSDLESELDRAVNSFTDSFATAVNNLPDINPTVDTTSVTAELGDAITGTDAVVVPQAETDGLQTAIVDAVDSAPAVVNADTSALSTSIDDAVTSTHPEITPELNTEELAAQLSGLGDELGGIDLSGQFGDAQLQAQDLADTLGELQDQSGATSDKLGVTANVSTVMSTAFSAAKGEGRQLIGALGQLGGGFGPVIARAAGVTLGFTALFEAGERASAATERVRTVLGGAADQIEHIDVGGLNGDLGKLAVQAGQSATSLRSAAASAAQVGLASGATKPQVVAFANSVNALALHAVALNPALGDAGAVSERLNVALARGGRFLNRYGIDLNQTQITLRALSDTGKSSARDLTFFERSVAGAELAVQQFNGQIGTQFARGTEQASVHLKRIKAELAAAFANAGKPLVEPTINALDSLAVVATELSVVLGQIGTAAIPALTALFGTLGALKVPLEGFSAVLHAVPAPLLTAVVALGAFRLAAGPIAGVLQRAGVAVVDFAENTRVVGTASEFVGNKVYDLGGKLDTSRANFATAATGAILFTSSLHGMGANIEQTVTGIGGLALAGSQIGVIFGEPVLGAAIGAAVGGIISLGKALFSTGNDAAKMAEDVKKLVTELDGLGNRQAANKFVETTAGSLDKLQTSFHNAGESAARYARENDVALDQAENAVNRAKDTVKKFETEFALLAAKNPAQAKRVYDGLVAMGHAVPTKELDALHTSLTKGADAADRHARNSREDADANQKLGAAVDKSGASIAIQAKTLQAAQQTLSAYATSTADSRDRAAEFASTLESVLAPKLDDVSTIFDDLLGAVGKFTDGLGAPDVSNYTQTLTDTTQATTHWLDTVQFLFSQGLTGLAGLVLERGPEVSKDLIDQIINSGPDQRQAWNDALAAGFTAFAENQQRAKDEGTALSAAAAEGIAGNPNDIIDAMRKKLTGLAKFSQLVQVLLREGETGLLGKLESMGAEAAGQYVDGLLSATPAERAALNSQAIVLQQGIDDNQEIIDRGAVASAEAFGTAAERSAANYAQGLQPIPTSADEAMAQAEVAIRSHGESARVAGSIVGAAAEAGVIAKTQQIPSDVGGIIGVVPGIIDAYSPEAYTHGLGYGEAITRGIAYGIAGEAALAAARASIGNVIDQLDAEAHAILQASRVSKRFIPHGQAVARGIAVGIQREMGSTVATFASSLRGLDNAVPGGGSGLGGFGAAPTVAGAVPLQVQVVIDPSRFPAGGSSVDSSIHDIVVHQYGPDVDTRGRGLVSALRDYQTTGG